jgi:hypothetical protein
MYMPSLSLPTNRRIKPPWRMLIGCVLIALVKGNTEAMGMPTINENSKFNL